MGGYSQIRAELRLLKTATETYHNYYHLLSGMDYPLKSQDYIYGFFQQNQGKEFIGFDSNKTVDYKERVRYYYFFQDRIGRNAGKIVALYYIFQQKLLFLQKKLHVDRTRKCPFKIYKGTNWFSITHDLATYLLQRTELIEKYFSHGLCTDEVFLQTIAMSSPYKENIVDNSLRYIDWERGNPYVFTNEDYEELITSDKLFARKFDEDIDSDIVNKVSEYLRISNF